MSEPAAAADDAIDPALEREYALRARHPERQSVYDRMAAASAAFREHAPARLAERYGDGPRCTLDLFTVPGAARPTPLLVFVHGGYWRALDNRIFSYLARAWTETGIAVAMPGYDLSPGVGLHRIADELEAALRWLGERADALGLRRDAVVLSGHSAGGHLAAVLAARDPARLGGIRARGVAGLSGLYDLAPLRRTSIGRDVRFGPDVLATLNPIDFARFEPAAFVLGWGGLETEGFRSQSLAFAARLRALGHRVATVEAAGRTHFDLLDDLADPAAPLFAATRALFDPPPLPRPDPPPAPQDTR